MLGEYVRYLLDLVAPPRRTELIVRTLSLKTLSRIMLRGDKAGSLPYHDARVTALVWEVKYYADSRAASLAGAVLADVLIGIASEELGKPLLIPVPMHGVRRRERGHNQTEVLCEAALKRAAGFYDYVPRALLRLRHTPAQQGLHKHERVENLKGAMHVQDESKIKGRVCVVIDDVSTTGATFAEAIRALKAAGAARVECVALAYS
ncbi:MAG TPA: phosphoribosyltransferase family protein [Candidatus Paceibacterota bacterium]|nr:phosphoribosyltransferase family protein [Candidatus Paceibacterota bacterium]